MFRDRLGCERVDSPTSSTPWIENKSGRWGGWYCGLPVPPPLTWSDNSDGVNSFNPPNSCCTVTGVRRLQRRCSPCSTILRQIVRGEHNPSLDHLDQDQAEFVNYVLAQIATPAANAEEP